MGSGIVGNQAGWNRRPAPVLGAVPGRTSPDAAAFQVDIEHPFEQPGPADAGDLSCNTPSPARLRWSRSLAMAGR